MSKMPEPPEGYRWVVLKKESGSDLFRERRGSGHWGRYADPSEIFARYRVCLVCKRVTRNPATMSNHPAPIEPPSSLAA